MDIVEDIVSTLQSSDAEELIAQAQECLNLLKGDGSHVGSGSHDERGVQKGLHVLKGFYHFWKERSWKKQNSGSKKRKHRRHRDQTSKDGVKINVGVSGCGGCHCGGCVCAHGDEHETAPEIFAKGLSDMHACCSDCEDGDRYEDEHSGRGYQEEVLAMVFEALTGGEGRRSAHEPDNRGTIRKYASRIIRKLFRMIVKRVKGLGRKKEKRYLEPMAGYYHPGKYSKRIERTPITVTLMHLGFLRRPGMGM